MTILRVNILRGASSADLADFLLAANGGGCIPSSTEDSNAENSVSPNDIVLKFETPMHTPRGRGKGHPREDLSAWFNYGFTEATFKSWIAWQLSNRHRLAGSGPVVSDGPASKRRRLC